MLSASPLVRGLLLATCLWSCGPARPAPQPARPAAREQPAGASSAASSGATGTAAAQPPTPASVEQRRKALAALLAEHWEYTLRVSPELASILADRRYNDQWTDLSSAAIQKRIADTRTFLQRFEAIDPTDLPEQEALSHRLMLRDLRQSLDNVRFEDWLMPVNQFGGVHLGIASLPPMLAFGTVKDYEDYLARLDKLPLVLEQVTALMREGMAKKLMPPRILLVQCVEQAAALARGKPERSPFYGPAKRFAKGISRAEQARLRGQILAAVRGKVQPAYAAFATFLQDTYVPQGREDPGLWALPDGAERYAARVKEVTTTNLSPVQIHELGRAEVARIEDEQAEIGKKLGFATLEAFRKHVRSNRKLRSKSAGEILARYRKHTAQMASKLPELFGRLPKQRMEIQKTEAFREKQAAGAEYQQGAPDGSRPGMVRVNTYQPQTRLWIDMESTAYHEGVPGHHLQNAIQQELTELPPFRQQANYVAYGEGWALYSERLGKELGFYQDPYSDYGRLQDEMLRAIRLVVDTGFHAKKWQRDKVVQFFREHSTIDEVSIQAETDRYIAIPGQALGYKVGQLTILRLREQAQRELGKAFDLRAFHDTILGAGALPLEILEERIAAWIAAQQAATAPGGD
ncbi:MAG TPA: DUF885 domain-containing protein [Kofleriaceae bacterium]|nr:DUF885 domain-containing protein [Kofleriaceae bacterium]